nr:ABC transporter substrate-binding protein [Schaalia vaccimaxillae]
MNTATRWGGTIAAAALILSACSSAPSDQSSAVEQTQSTIAAESVTVGLTYIPNVQFSPVYVAEDHGLFDDRGIDATIRHHGSDEGLFTALISGEEHVVVASGDEAMVARDQGMDLVSIGAYYRSYPATVIVPADSDIDSLDDLKGKSIGIPGEYGSNWYAALSALKQAGLTREDVKIESIGYTQQAAIAQKSVDAVIGFTNNDLVQMRRGGIDVRTVDLDPEQTALVAASIITTRQWAQDNPEQAKAVVSAITSGTQMILNDPELAISATQKRDDTLTQEEQLDTARAVLQATLELMVDDSGKASAVQDLDVWKNMAVFLADVPDLVSTTPDAGKAVTNDYVSQ